MEVSFLFFSSVAKPTSLRHGQARADWLERAPLAPRPHVENGESVEQPFRPGVHASLNPDGSSAWRLLAWFQSLTAQPTVP